MASPWLNHSLWFARASSAVLAFLVLGTVPARGEDAAVGVASGQSLLDRSEIAGGLAVEHHGGLAAEGETLILAVQVNAMDHGLAQFRLIDSQLWATRGVLRNLGLKVGPVVDNDDELISLGGAFGEAVTYDAASQSLSLMVAVEKLAVGKSVLNSGDDRKIEPQEGTGALINYDFYATYSDDRVTFDGFTELRAFSGNALIENTSLARFGPRSFGPDAEIVRLDTTVSLAFPGERLTLRAGDVITRSTDWSRSIRLGGVRFGTDFALQPYLVSGPIPAFFGEAALPSTVDLYINGLKRYSGEVAPGPFEIGSGGNRINGAGHAEVVVTDALGQVQTLSYPVYDAPELLRPGLTDWSIEVGAVRKNYGLSSFGYHRDPVASGSVRFGATDRLTIEAHLEAARFLANGGAGAAWLVPFGGVATASLALSAASGKTGTNFSFGYSWVNSSFYLSASGQRASKSYTDIATRYEAGVPLARDVATVGYNSARLGSFGASFIRQRVSDDEKTSLLGFNWQKTFSDRLSVNLSASQDLVHASRRSAFISLNIAAGRRDNISASLQANERRTTSAVSWRRSVPYEGGTGWAVNASHDGDRVQAAAQVDHLGSSGQATGGVRFAGSDVAAYLGYSGSVVFMDGSVYAARKIQDGFALISTNGVADVPVKLQNREVGRTDQHGHLLLTGLNAYQSNLVGIDPSELPLELTLEKVEAEAVPAARAGVLVPFEVVANTSLLVTVVDENGQALPLGAVVSFDGDELPQAIGFDGQLYLEKMPKGRYARVRFDSGACTLDLADIVARSGAGEAGTLVCRRTDP